MSIISRVLRAGEGKALKDLESFAQQVGAFEPQISKLSDEELAAKTVEFRGRLERGAPVDDLAAESFAVVREAAQRILGLRPYDVQVVGAAALHRGSVVEMRTGEGKTLVSTMPAYLNGLAGTSVHIVTVNDYLASRDAEWMGNIHRFLGLNVGLIQSEMTPAERRVAYAADITYGTNNEFGFDYLRDNMAMTPESMVQRGHDYAIVDEVDSILVDEARTPLIISGRVGETGKWYRDFAKIVDRLRRDEHYEVDEAKRQVLISEEGIARVEEILGVENLYDHTAVDFVHHLDVALKAKELYAHDVEYLIVEGEIKIVDEFTGRVLEGRRYSEGLHQAIEAKEGVKIKEENQTLATITLQNFFRMYDKLSGMTGTAKTEEGEFKEIYDLDVVVVPTNRPIARDDKADLVYKSEKAKFDALIDDITERHERGQPCLIGTISIERSELLSKALDRRQVKHEVLNAKQHAREAEIIAQAGRFGAVTVATNMAGRGVDINLGGNAEGMALAATRRTGYELGTPEWDKAHDGAWADAQAIVDEEQAKVLSAGGLYVIGTERHDSRRIDNQLRGRSGRQGDPGESRFYLSLEDDLMRRFSGERVTKVMETLRLPEDMPIEAKMVSKSVERAQAQVESQNFEVRKNVLKYDEVMNRQREVIYSWRSGILQGTEAERLAKEWTVEAVGAAVVFAVGEGTGPNSWDLEELVKELTVLFPITLTEDSLGAARTTHELVELAVDDARSVYRAREAEFGEEVIRAIERRVALSVIDNKWREHLAEMDYLRSGIGLRAMGQRDPLVEYQNEAYDAFADLVESVKRDSVRYLFHVQLAQPEPVRPKVQVLAASGGGAAPPQQAKAADKVGRNQPCPCGSGKKYKMCHGAA